MNCEAPEPIESKTLDIRPLSDDEEGYRQKALALAAHYLDSANPLPIQKVQELYQVVAENFRESDKALVAVGIAFGETIHVVERRVAEGYAGVRKI